MNESGAAIMCNKTQTWCSWHAQQWAHGCKACDVARAEQPTKDPFTCWHCGSEQHSTGDHKHEPRAPLPSNPTKDPHGGRPMTLRECMESEEQPPSNPLDIGHIRRVLHDIAWHVAELDKQFARLEGLTGTPDETPLPLAELRKQQGVVWMEGEIKRLRARVAELESTAGETAVMPPVSVKDQLIAQGFDPTLAEPDELTADSTEVQS